MAAANSSGSFFWWLVAIIAPVAVWLLLRDYSRIWRSFLSFGETTYELRFHILAMLAGTIGTHAAVAVTLLIGDVLLPPSRSGAGPTDYTPLFAVYTVALPFLALFGILAGLIANRRGESHGTSIARRLALSFSIGAGIVFAYTIPLGVCVLLVVRPT